MADEKLQILITAKARLAELKKADLLLAKLGGKTAVNAQKRLNKVNREIKSLSGETKKGNIFFSRFTKGIAAGNLIARAAEESFKLLVKAITSVGKATLLSARIDVLNKVLLFTGKNAGFAKDQLIQTKNAIQNLGIAELEALQIQQRFIQAELNIADATKIARLAQDAAVIAGVNSSEAAIQITDAINKQRPILLKQFGIMVNLETVTRKYAKELGKSRSELTQSERKQALLNAVLAEGENISGAYETAMKEVGKQLTSLPRKFATAARIVGKVFKPALELAVGSTNALLDAFNDLFGESTKVIRTIADVEKQILKFKNIEAATEFVKDLREELELMRLSAVATDEALQETFSSQRKDDIKAIKDELQGAAAFNLLAQLDLTSAGFVDLNTKASDATITITSGIDFVNQELNKLNIQVVDTSDTFETYKGIVTGVGGAYDLAAVKISKFRQMLNKVLRREDFKLIDAETLLELESGREMELLGEREGDKFAEGFAGRTKDGIKILQNEISETLGQTGSKATKSLTQGLRNATSAARQLFSVLRGGKVDLFGLIEIGFTIAGLFSTGGLFAKKPVFDDPINDASLTREFRRIGDFIAKGLGQSAINGREPVLAGSGGFNIENLTVMTNASDPKEVAREIVNLRNKDLTEIQTDRVKIIR